MNQTVKELEQLTAGQLTMGLQANGNERAHLGRIVTDSRRIEPGDVFWAIPGQRYDGADFVGEAYARGAAGVVAQRSVDPRPARWSLHVRDAVGALWQVAREKRRRFQGKVIAVTGSVGKTTTREMIHTVLAQSLSGTTSPHNFNNHLGVPLSMLGWRDHDDYAVVELGASRGGEIERLAALCAPHVGVITRLGEAHLDSFGSLQGIDEAKAELLAALPPDGWAILNADDARMRRVRRPSRHRVLWVGASPTSEIQAVDIQNGQGQLRFHIDGQPLSLPVWGRHHLSSALVAVAVGRLMQLDLRQIANALGHFQPPPRRCQVVQMLDMTIIDDTYNASPTAMWAALELLRDFETAGRKVVVCGDMRELGASAIRWHRRLGDQMVTSCGVDLIVACGDHARDVVTGARDAGMALSQAIACRSPHDALPVLSDEVVLGDVVLVKGSRALAMETIVAALEQIEDRRPKTEDQRQVQLKVAA